MPAAAIRYLAILYQFAHISLCLRRQVVDTESSEDSAAGVNTCLRTVIGSGVVAETTSILDSKNPGSLWMHLTGGAAISRHFSSVTITMPADW